MSNEIIDINEYKEILSSIKNGKWDDPGKWDGPVFHKMKNIELQ